MGLSKKLNKNRRFPEATKQPCNYDKQRKEDALERKAAYETLSIEERIEMLNRRLGVGVGAVRQRARLAAQLEEQKHPTTKPVVEEAKPAEAVSEVAAKEEVAKPKRYMAGK